MGGIYTEIVTIIAPGDAIPGETVSIEVRIKNTYSSTIGIMAGGAMEYGVVPWPGISFPDNVANVGPGETRSFTGWFTMPDANVKIHAYSYYYGGDGSWHFDDEKTKEVSLAELVSEFSQFTIADYLVV